MNRFRSLSERQEDRAKAREKLAERAQKVAAKSKRPTKNPKPKPELRKGVVPSVIDAMLPAREERPWASVRCGDAPVNYQARASEDRIVPQPWARALVSTLLAAADTGEVALCLVWPAKLTGLPLLHAMANIERVFAKDMRGLRTILYPGTHASRAQLQSVLVDRKDLNSLFCSLWIEQDSGVHETQTYTSSPAFRAVLLALNDITHSNNEVSNSSLAELVPTFVLDQNEKIWKASAADPLQRTMSKVKNRAIRSELRQRVNLEWGNPDKAPGSLMVMHHTLKKESWRTALAAQALKGQGCPEVLLLDATDAARRTNYGSVNRIPEFLRFARENGFSDKGAVIVTDDPKTFFVLRSQLRDAVGALKTKVLAAESEEVVLSASPFAADWQPAQRSNSNFRVGIVDRDASQLALTFQRLTASAGSEESPTYQALLETCMYVMRLSNMPAGYADLTAAASDVREGDYGSQQNAWTPIKLKLAAALDSGVLNQVRDAVERAIARADKLIDDWNDATPMASRVLAEVRKHADVGRQGISLVLPSNRYVLLAHRFLQRKLGASWTAVEERIEWHTLSSVGKTLTGDRKGKHFAFVGINPDVLRILLTHPQVPHGTAVLLAYRQAESTLTTLTSMKEVDAFKAYRGRIGLLAQEIGRRLAEVPNPLDINKLREMSLTFKFDDNSHNGQSGEQAYHTFELEGGSRAYASGWVFRHVPDEDPPFRRAAATAIQPGDFIFDMNDELRAKLESSLQLNGEGVSSVVDPIRTLLKLYHDDVQRRCVLLFKATKRSALAREIHAKMVELDPKAEDCRPGRVYYWLDLQAKDDARPHASKDSKYFKIFCKALGISDEAAEQHWGFVRNARRLNQYLGRELVARYAEILFQPESAATYRKVPDGVIHALQQEALHCVYRVERVVPPLASVASS